MKYTYTSIPGVVVIEPDVYTDHRGFFLETYHQKKYGELEIHPTFRQDNLSHSVKGTLRGLHYQHPHPQAKLVQVFQGEVFDVVVDIRRGSPAFGRWTGAHLTGDNKRQIYIPEGLAHGFCVLSDTALLFYKCTDFYAPDCERGVLWSDPDIGIAWPMEEPLLSEKDAQSPRLKDIPPEHLPSY